MRQRVSTLHEETTYVSRLSILIPYLGKTKLLEDTLVSVLENRPADSEILVVMARHYEDPYDLGDEVRFLPTANRVGLMGCVNFGLALARAEVVHVLLCGTVADDGWADSAMSHFDNPVVGCVAPLVVDARTPDRVVAAGVDYHAGGRMQLLRSTTATTKIDRSPTVVLGPHPTAAFYRRSALNVVGRFDLEAGDRFGSLDLALRLDHAGYQTVLEPHSQVRLLPGAVNGSETFRRALEAEQFFWRWAPRAGWGRSLGLHALHLMAEGCQTLLHPRILAWTAGRLAGCGAIGEHRRCRERLERAAETVEKLKGSNGPVASPHFASGSAGPARAGAVALRR